MNIDETKLQQIIVTQVGSLLEAQDRRFDARLEARLQDQDERINARLDAQDVRLDAKLEAQDQRLDAKLQAQDQRLDAKLQAQDERINAQLEAQDERIRSQLETQDQRISAQLETQDQRISAQLQEQDQRLDARLATKFAVFEERLEAMIDTRLAEFEQRLETRLVAKFDVQFVATRKHLEERFNNHTTKLFGLLSRRLDKLQETKADRAQVEKLQQTMDGVAGLVHTEENERAFMNHQLDRHETWFGELAKHTALALSAP